MKKRVSMLMVFIIGLTLFATSVLASTTSKSGYEILRDSVETTVLTMPTLDNFTISSQVIVKYDGQEIYRQTASESEDRQNYKFLRTNIQSYKNNENYFNYFYRDKTKYISSYDDIEYTVEKYNNSDYSYEYVTSDYEKQTIKTMKKIADAAVTTFNMQNVVTAFKDGNGYNLSISFNEGQIPALFNAILSAFYMQYQDVYKIESNYQYNDAVETYYKDNIYQAEMPTNNYQGYNNGFISYNTLEDLYIKSVNGESHVNKDNIIDKVSAKAIFTGVDVEGNDHKLEIEIFYEVSNINSTVINEPDLTGKTVKNVDNSYEEPNIIDRDKELIKDKKQYELLLGDYVTDIIRIEDNKMKKVGEIKLSLTEVDENNYIHVQRYAEEGGVVKTSEFTIMPYAIDSYSNQITMIDSYISKYLFDLSTGVVIVYDNKQLYFTRVFE